MLLFKQPKFRQGPRGRVEPRQVQERVAGGAECLVGEADSAQPEELIELAVEAAPAAEFQRRSRRSWKRTTRRSTCHCCPVLEMQQLRTFEKQLQGEGKDLRQLPDEGPHQGRLQEQAEAESTTAGDERVNGSSTQIRGGLDMHVLFRGDSGQARSRRDGRC